MAGAPKNYAKDDAKYLTGHDFILISRRRDASNQATAVRLKLEQNQLVDVFDEIRILIDGLEGA